MRRITWGLAVALSAVVGLSLARTLVYTDSKAVTFGLAAASADCPADPPDAATSDAACEVTRLGWHAVDPGPPLRFRTSDGVVEVAIAAPGRPAGGDDPIGWAKMKLAGPKGAFGPLGDCPGKFDFPDGAKNIWTGIDCTVPPGPDGPRKGGMFVVATPAGLQVIGTVKPPAMNVYKQPLWGLAADGRGVGITARAVRAAIAVFLGREYYLAPDAGISELAIEGVYHHWRWQQIINRGLVDTGSDYVLFKNGEAWRSPDAGPQDIDPARFKEARWADWGTWRRAGGVVVLTMNGQTEVQLSPKDLIRYDPAGANERVEGRWAWNSGFSSSFSTVNTSRSIALHADGRFEESGFTGAFSTGTGRRDPHWAVAAPAPAHDGRYRITGYSLELTYDDDRRNSALFYWAGDGNNDRHSMLLMNGIAFLGGLSR